MKAFRAVLAVVIVANVALLVVFQSVRSREMQYRLVEKQAEVRRLALENEALRLEVTEARRPEALLRRAEALHIDVKHLDYGSIVKLSEPRRNAEDLAKGPKKPRP